MLSLIWPMTRPIIRPTVRPTMRLTTRAGMARGRREPPRRHRTGRYLLIALLLGGLSATIPEAQAGLFGWLWPASRQEQFERAVDVAHKTAAAASQLVESQSQQAAAQADQNARVAELLGALALERQSLAGHVARFEEAHRRESVMAAALVTLAPAIVSGAALLLGGLAMWAVTRPGPLDAHAALGLLELAGTLPTAGRIAADRIAADSITADRIRPSRTIRSRGAASSRRLPAEPTHERGNPDEAELPF